MRPEGHDRQMHGGLMKGLVPEIEHIPPHYAAMLQYYQISRNPLLE